jgi:hypothetical protein
MFFVLPTAPGTDEADGLPSHGEDDGPEFLADLADGDLP